MDMAEEVCTFSGCTDQHLGPLHTHPENLRHLLAFSRAPPVRKGKVFLVPVFLVPAGSVTKQKAQMLSRAAGAGNSSTCHSQIQQPTLSFLTLLFRPAPAGNRWLADGSLCTHLRHSASAAIKAMEVAIVFRSCTASPLLLCPGGRIVF
jgi:hypothetical protein